MNSARESVEKLQLPHFHSSLTHAVPARLNLLSPRQLFSLVCLVTSCERANKVPHFGHLEPKETEKPKRLSRGRRYRLIASRVDRSTFRKRGSRRSVHAIVATNVASYVAIWVSSVREKKADKRSIPTPVIVYQLFLSVLQSNGR